MTTTEIKPQQSYNVMQNITISQKRIDDIGLRVEVEFSADIVFYNPDTGDKMTKIKCYAVSRNLGSPERVLKEAVQKFIDGHVNLGQFELEPCAHVERLCLDTIHYVDLNGYPQEWVDFFNAILPKDWTWTGLNHLKTTV